MCLLLLEFEQAISFDSSMWLRNVHVIAMSNARFLLCTKFVTRTQIHHEQRILSHKYYFD